MSTDTYALSTRQVAALFAVIALLATLSVGPRFADAVEPGVPVVFIATGGNFPDALAGGALAALAGGPLLFVTRDTIPPATAEELERLEPQRIVILGGRGVISAEVEVDLGDFTAAPVERISGADRFATAAEISKVLPDAPYAAADHDHDDRYALAVEHPARRDNISGLALGTNHGYRGGVGLELDDPCGGGATRWTVLATAHGAARAHTNPNLNVTYSINLDRDPGENPDARTILTVQGDGQIHESFALHGLFSDVPPGERTFDVYASKSVDAFVVNTVTGKVSAVALGYDCA